MDECCDDGDEDAADADEDDADADDADDDALHKVARLSQPTTTNLPCQSNVWSLIAC